MREKKPPERFDQLLLFPDLEKLRDEPLSSEKLADLIRELCELKQTQDEIEENERCKAAEAERKRREQEEKERRDAHIREVT